MPVQARGVQIIIARDLTGRLPGSQPTVNLGALDMLTSTAFPAPWYLRLTQRNAPANQPPRAQRVLKFRQRESTSGENKLG